jgi:hypothetical protein
MLNFINPRRFFVAQYIVDFRKGPYGLLSEAMRAGVDPYARDFVAFVSRDRRKIKAITGDETGIILVFKIFSKGTLKTKINFVDHPAVQYVTLSEIGMLMEGSSYTKHKSAETWLPDRLKSD